MTLLTLLAIISGNRLEGDIYMDYEVLARELLRYKTGLPAHPPGEKILEVTRGEMSIIAFFTELKETATPSELSCHSGVSTARTASTLKSLEKKGMIVREMDPNDRRKVIVHMTEKGRLYGLERQKEALSCITEVLQGLGEADAKEYVRLMKRVFEWTIKRAKEDKKND